MEYVNLFVPNAPLLYPLKTSQNLTVFWRFQGVEKRSIGNEWVSDMIIEMLASDDGVFISLNVHTSVMGSYL